jgi:RND family efflux transporter MFP subunit
MFNTIINFIKNKYKLLLAILIITGIGGYFFWQQAQADQQELVFKNPQTRNLIKSLDVSGIVDAQRKAQLRFIAGGKITYLGAKRGEFVKKWQTIATIDQRELQKRLDKTLNNYMTERWDWEQTQDDTKDRWLPKDESRQVDQKQWRLKNTVLDVEIQSIAISNTVMSAPFDGILVHSPIDTANVQVLASDYFKLIDPTSLIFKAEVDEEDVAQLTLGQPSTITLDAYSDETLNSQIDYISYQSAETRSGTVFLVEFPLNSDDLNKYRLGMNGDAQIELARKENVLTVPIIATKERGNKFFVDVKTANGQTAGSQTEEKQIETGLETDEYIEVISGLTEQDKIVIPQD